MAVVNGQIRLWNLIKTTSSTRFAASAAETLALEKVASAVWVSDDEIAFSSAQNVSVWNLKTRKTIRTWRAIQSEDYQTMSLFASPKNHFLAIATGNVIEMRDTRNGRLLARAEVSSSPYARTVVAFSIDGKRVAVARGDNTIQLRDAKTLKIAATFAVLPAEKPNLASQNALIHTPQGFYVASGNAEKFLRARVGGKMSSIAPTRSQFRRDDKVRDVLRGY